MRKNKKHIAIGLGLLLISVSLLALQKQTDIQAEDTTKGICYEPVENLQEYLTGNATITITNKDSSTDTCRTKIPEKEGYVFAGFYAEQNEKSPISQDSTATSAYAKFVPEEILSVKSQCRDDLASVTNGGTSSMRFVTAVDSFSYENIGFRISIGSNYSVHRYSNTVYDTLYGVGETSENGTVMEEYKPSTEFHEQAKYFKTWTYTEIPYAAFNTAMTVTPFWITKDGSIVYGDEKLGYYVNQGRGEAYNVTQDDYGTLKSIIDNASAGDVIQVQRDMELGTATTISQSITITTDGYERVITCMPTGSSKLITLSATPITIKGASANARLVFDGTDQALKSATIYSGNSSARVFSMQYVTMRNINNSGSSSGAIRLAGINSLTIENCIFDNCTQKGAGGAVYSNAATNQITNSTFQSCSSTGNNAGAIYCNKTMTISGSTFKKCEAASNGGCIFIQATPVITIQDSVFEDNKSTNYGGAIAFDVTKSIAATLNLLGDCTFSGNVAGGHDEGFSGGAVMVPVTLNIGNGTISTNVQMIDNNCTKYEYGEAICIGLGYKTDSPTEVHAFAIKDNAALNIYSEDTYTEAYVCTIYTDSDAGIHTSNIEPTEVNYSTTAPVTE